MKKLFGIAAAAMLAGASMTLSLPAAAAETITTTTQLTRTCVPFQSGGAATSLKPGETLTVTHPDSVRPNEVFTVKITPGVVEVNNRVGRVSYDFNLPQGVQLLDARTLDAGENMTNPGSVAQFTRVGADRKANPNGSVLRYWGGASTGPGDNSANVFSGFFDVNYSFDNGLKTGSRANFRLPEFELRLRANPDFTGNIVFSLPGAGAGGSATDGSRNNFTFMESNLLNSKSFSYYCGVSANASNIATIAVAGEMWQAPSTTTLVNPPAEAESGKPVQLQARVSAPAASAAELQAGQVEFVDAAGSVLATAPVDASGLATTQITFPALADGETSKQHSVFARFKNAATVAASQSPATTITVVPKIYVTHEFAVNLTVDKGQLGQTGMPVTVTANLSGATIPEGLQVEILKNGSRLGDLRPVPANGVVTLTDNAARSANDSFYRYQARVVELVTGDDRYIGESDTVPVLVQGTNPNSDLTPGYEPLNGTNSLTNILADPDALWGQATGSVRGLGALSLQMTANP